MVTYRTDDPARWGIGKGSNLTASEVDGNFWELAQRLVAVETNPAKPNNISSITVTGSQMTVHMEDGSTHGPFTLPTAMIHYRGDWVAGVSYDELDVIAAPNSAGLYLSARAHVAAATFDRNAVDAAGNRLYQWLFPTQATGISGLSDVVVTAPVLAQVLRFNGTEWANVALGWADVANKPATFPPSAHTHLWADLTDKPATFPPSAHTHPWADVTGKPATVAALPATLGAVGQVMKVDAAGTGVVWAADDSGTGGSTNLDGLSDVAITTPAAAQFLRFDGTTWVNAAAAWADVVQKPATVAALPAALGAAGQVMKVDAAGTGIVWAADDAGAGGGALNDLSDVAITTPAAGQVVQFDGTGWVNSPLNWAEIPDKPGAFPPSAHTHPWADVTGRPAVVDALPAALGVAGQLLKVNSTADGFLWAADDSGGVAGDSGYTHWRVRNRAIQTYYIIAELTFGAANETGSTIIYSGQNTTNVAANAFDNNASTIAQIEPIIDGWIGLQLATATNVTEVTIQAGDNTTRAGGAPVDFVIERSNDGTAWEVVREITGEPAWAIGEARTFTLTAWDRLDGKPATIEALPPTIGGSGQILKVQANGTIAWDEDEGAAPVDPHRHWRLRFITGQSATYAGITELFLNGLSHTGTVTASSVYSTYAAANAFDDNLTTLWVSANPPAGEWVAIDLGAGNELDVSSVDIHSRPSGTLYEPLEFAIEWSDNGVDWNVSWEQIVTPNWVNNERRTFTRPALSGWDKLDGKPATITALPATVGIVGEILKVQADGTIAWAADNTRENVFSTKTANYTLGEADLDGKTLIEMNLTTANTVTIPAGLTRKGDLGIIQLGAGQTSVVAGTGVTIRSAKGLRVSGQFGMIQLIPRGGDVYYLTGDLVV